MQMHAQIAHQEHHRILEACRAWPVGRVKQVPEPMVHARNAKQVNTVQVPWLQHPARTAPLDFSKVILGKCRAPFAVLVSSTMLWGPRLVKHARLPRFPM